MLLGFFFLLRQYFPSLPLRPKSSRAQSFYRPWPFSVANLVFVRSTVVYLCILE